MTLSSITTLHNSDFTRADFRNGHLSSRDTQFLVSCIKRHKVEYLDITGNRLSNKALKQLTIKLVASEPLSALRIGFDTLNGKGLAVFKLLMGKRDWVCLDLSFRSLTKRSIEILKQGLTSQSRLKDLRIAVKIEKDDVFIKLVDILSRIKLQSVSLHLDSFKMKHAYAIAGLLEKDKLKAFGFSAHSWYDDIGQAFFDGIEKAESLRYLDLRSNVFRSEYLNETLVETISKLPKLKWLGIEDWELDVARYVSKLGKMVCGKRVLEVNEAREPGKNYRGLSRARVLTRLNARAEKADLMLMFCKSIPNYNPTEPKTFKQLPNNKVKMLSRCLIERRLLSSHAKLRMRERFISKEELLKTFYVGQVTANEAGDSMTLRNPDNGLTVVLSKNCESVVTAYFDGKYAVQSILTFSRGSNGKAIRRRLTRIRNEEGLSNKIEDMKEDSRCPLMFMDPQSFLGSMCRAFGIY
ncbi:MAG: hypothetical protein H7A40_03140 [Chlamydiales bacterium]|nr:hypothetical protein [Chlamydiales bacterium]